MDSASYLQIFVSNRRQILSIRPANMRNDIRLVGVQLGRANPRLFRKYALRGLERLSTIGHMGSHRRTSFDRVLQRHLDKQNQSSNGLQNKNETQESFLRR